MTLIIILDEKLLNLEIIFFMEKIKLTYSSPEIKLDVIQLEQSIAAGSQQPLETLESSADVNYEERGQNESTNGYSAIF